jgi:hypothetical protein
MHGRLVSVYGQKVFSRKEVSVRFNKLNDGQTALNDDPEIQGGRQRTSHNDDNCIIVRGLIREDRRAKVHETRCKNT